MTNTFIYCKDAGPIVASAIHDGHATRDSLQSYFALNDAERLREEDPYTAVWARVVPNHIIFNNSRFETDINRSRDKAVYLKPEDAWGLQVWKHELPEEEYKASLAVYDDFYNHAGEYFDKLFGEHKEIVLYDIHTYNYKRSGIDIEADADSNPEVNIGTRNMNGEKWFPLVNLLIDNLKNFDYLGRMLDVRENVKFKGGYFGQWLHERYGDKICTLSIEYKKFFMEEWTGEADHKAVAAIEDMIRKSLEPVYAFMTNSQ